MTWDRSLDEFIDTGGHDDDSHSDNDGDTEITGSNGELNNAGDETTQTDDTHRNDQTTNDSTVTATTPGDVSPAVTTLQCDPSGVSCPRCGKIVTQRWRAQQQTEGDSMYICSDCKNW